MGPVTVTSPPDFQGKRAWCTPLLAQLQTWQRGMHMPTFQAHNVQAVLSDNPSSCARFRVRDKCCGVQPGRQRAGMWYNSSGSW